MNIEITGRNTELTDEIKSFVQKKLATLERVLDDPIDVHVVLSVDKHRHIAEIHVSCPNQKLDGSEETGELKASIGQVIDKLERQARRHKEKGHSHKRRQTPRDPEIAATIESVAREEAEGVKREA